MNSSPLIICQSKILFFFVRMDSDHTCTNQLHQDSRSPTIADVYKSAIFPHPNPFMLLEIIKQSSFILPDSNCQRWCIRIFILKNFYNLPTRQDCFIIHPDILPTHHVKRLRKQRLVRLQLYPGNMSKTLNWLYHNSGRVASISVFLNRQIKANNII